MPLDDGLYASLADFETFVGQDFLRSFVGGQESEETAPRLRSLLLTATAQINSALARGGYAIPVLDSAIDPCLLTQTKQLLAARCCIFAAKFLAASASELPPALKALIAEAATWESDIASRKTDLLGVSRPSADVAGRAAGNFVFVASGDGPDFPAGFYSLRQTLA